MDLRMARRASWIVLLFSFLGIVVGEYDYIVVGAGASGCVVAPKLAASGKKVLLLEAGGPTAWDFGGRYKGESGVGYFNEINPEDPITVFEVPGEDARLRTHRQYWWGNLPWSNNGLGIGGSGMMNGALTFKAVPSDMESWPKGWKFEDLRPHYDAVFEALPVTETSSSDGLLYNQRAAEYFDRMVEKRLGMCMKDLNSYANTRVNTYSVTQVTAEAGKRVESCLTFLRPALDKMENLKLKMHSEVTHLTFETRGNARGVVLKGYNNKEYLLNPGGSIISTAGTYQTARLLLASGVGPWSELQRLYKYGLVLNEIPYWIVNDEVGKDLHDHTLSTVTVKVPNAEDFSFRTYEGHNGEKARLMYANDQAGGYAQFGTVRIGFLSLPGSTSPDVELLVMGSGEEGSGADDCGTCFRIFIAPLSPKARDQFLLKTPDMDCYCTDLGSNPITCATGQICKLHLYKHENEYDLNVAAWGMDKVVKAALAEGYEVLSPSRHDMNAIIEYLRTEKKAQYPAHHVGGSCKIGKCTDLNLKVRGLENVYVADNSLNPGPLSAHSVGTVLAMAHKAAALILNQNSTVY